MILIPYCGMILLLPGFPLLYILAYAVSALILFRLFRCQKLMDYLGFKANTCRIVQSEKILLMMSALLVYGLRGRSMLLDSGIDTKDLAVVVEQLLVLTAGHYFWIITDYGELVKDLQRLRENFLFKAFLFGIVLVVSFFLFDSCLFILPFIGIAFGMGTYIFVSVHSGDGTLNVPFSSKKKNPEENQ